MICWLSRSSRSEAEVLFPAADSTTTSTDATTNSPSRRISSDGRTKGRPRESRGYRRERRVSTEASAAGPGPAAKATNTTMQRNNKSAGSTPHEGNAAKAITADAVVETTAIV